MNFEGPTNKPLAKSTEETDFIDHLSEEEAEEQLEEILANSKNKFLLEFPANREAIEGADSGKNALRFALAKLNEREIRLSKEKFQNEGVKTELSEMDHQVAVEKFKRIHAHAQRLGIGQDGYVVIDSTEERGPCYKFFLKETAPRGRNSLYAEFDLQVEVNKILAQVPGRIKAPKAFYAQEVGPEKMIAMERLPANSINDILCHVGRLPEWINIDEFCTDLQETLDAMHDKHIRHRDMHLGNVMVSQSLQDDGQPLGYIIDFGLSGHSYDEATHYRLEVGNEVFTYRQDDSIIQRVKEALTGIRNNQLKVNGV